MSLRRLLFLTAAILPRPSRALWRFTRRGTSFAAASSARTACRSSARPSRSRRSTATSRATRGPTRTAAITIAFPGDEGDYIVNIAALGFAAKTFEIKRTGDQEILVADAQALQVGDAARRREGPGAARQAASRRQRGRTSAAASESINGVGVSADQLGDLAALAASLPGVQLIPGADGDADGFSVLGLARRSERDDAQWHELRRREHSARRERLDVARRRRRTTFARQLQRRHAQHPHGPRLELHRPHRRARTSTRPQAQWTDAAGRALHQQYANISARRTVRRPDSVRTSRSSISRTSSAAGRATFRVCSTTDALGLQTAGISPDSVQPPRSRSSAGCSVPADRGRAFRTTGTTIRRSSSAASTSRRRRRPPARRSTSRTTAAGTARPPSTMSPTELPAHSGDRDELERRAAGPAHELFRLRHSQRDVDRRERQQQLRHAIPRRAERHACASTRRSPTARRACRPIVVRRQSVHEHERHAGERRSS